MIKRTLTLTAILAAVMALSMATPTRAGLPLSRVNYLTFVGPVKVPGAILAPGTYAFEAGANNTNRNIVRVSSRRDGAVLFHGFTIPVRRPATGPSVSLGEVPAGVPPPVTVWYEDGATEGHQFMYP